MPRQKRRDPKVEAIDPEAIEPGAMASEFLEELKGINDGLDATADSLEKIEGHLATVSETMMAFLTAWKSS